MVNKDFNLALALAMLEIVWTKGKITDEEWLSARESLTKKFNNNNEGLKDIKTDKK